MPLWKIAWRSIQHRAVASSLTAFSMALGVALVVAVLVIYHVLDRSFRRSSQGYDMIVGPAKGGPLEVVLSTVYYLQAPRGTIPYEIYEELHHGRFATEVAAAIPVCIGGNYAGYPVVGTPPEFFEEFRYLGDRPYEFEPGGRNFDPDSPFEAVIGATVARKAGLRVGDTFRVTHGLAQHGEQEHPFTIVGVLKPTGTPNDRALFVNIEGFWMLHQHDASHATRKSADESATETGKFAEGGDEHGSHEPESVAQGGHELTAVLVKRDWTNSAKAVALPVLVNKEPGVQSVIPAEEVAKLFEGLLGNIQTVLLIFAVLIVVVAGTGLMVSIYNSMNERKMEIAIMRALGAKRNTVMAVILLESILLSLGGGAIGAILGHGLIGAFSGVILEETGVRVTAFSFQTVELILVPGLIVLASVVGYLPALVAYRTDVAKAIASGV
ncbi:MAG: ABC transporter permease [Thermogutta sp.]